MDDVRGWWCYHENSGRETGVALAGRSTREENGKKRVGNENTIQENKLMYIYLWTIAHRI